MSVYDEYLRASEALRSSAAEELAQLQRGEVPTPRVTPEPVEPRAISTAMAAQRLVSMVFRSATDTDMPHVVTEQDGYVRCTCKAMRSIESRPALCWAVQEFRRVKGMVEP